MAAIRSIENEDKVQGFDARSTCLQGAGTHARTSHSHDARTHARTPTQTHSGFATPTPGLQPALLACEGSTVMDSENALIWREAWRALHEPHVQLPRVGMHVPYGLEKFEQWLQL